MEKEEKDDCGSGKKAMSLIKKTTYFAFAPPLRREVADSMAPGGTLLAPLNICYWSEYRSGALAPVE